MRVYEVVRPTTLNNQLVYDVIMKLLLADQLMKVKCNIVHIYTLSYPRLKQIPSKQDNQICFINMEEEEEERKELTLVARKACFHLPTACPDCLPVYIYLKFAQIPFHLHFNLLRPDSDQIPYVASGTYVVYNNEKGGVIESLIEDGIVDLDTDVHNIPEWVSTKAMITTWLTDAVMYELWVGSDGSSAHKIYYSDLPWPIGKLIFLKQAYTVKQLLGIGKDNAERREAEIYRRAVVAYGALSTRLGEQNFFFDSRPTSLDATFVGHALFTLHALPETSILRSKLLERDNLVQYARKLNTEYVLASSSSFVPVERASSTRVNVPSSWSTKPKTKTKRPKTEEEKTFRRRAKYFLAAQAVAVQPVLIFLSLMGGSDDDADVELDEADDEGFGYND